MRISRRRMPAEYAITPYKPMQASISAVSANAPTSDSIALRGVSDSAIASSSVRGLASATPVSSFAISARMLLTSDDVSSRVRATIE